MFGVFDWKCYNPTVSFDTIFELGKEKKTELQSRKKQQQCIGLVLILIAKRCTQQLNIHIPCCSLKCITLSCCETESV